MKVVAGLVIEDPIDKNGIIRIINVTDDGAWWAWSAGTGTWVRYLPALDGKREPSFNAKNPSK